MDFQFLQIARFSLIWYSLKDQKKIPMNIRRELLRFRQFIRQRITIIEDDLHL